MTIKPALSDNPSLPLGFSILTINPTNLGLIDSELSWIITFFVFWPEISGMSSDKMIVLSQKKKNKGNTGLISVNYFFWEGALLQE